MHLKLSAPPLAIPKTQHLVGTRNGEPYWAAPYEKKSPECDNVVM